MRLGLFVFALAACSSSASARPAWPRSTPHETDGGESLAPRAAARAIAAIAEDDRPVDRTPTTTATPAAATPVTPAATPATPATPDEPPITEEIVIEIED